MLAWITNLDMGGGGTPDAPPTGGAVTIGRPSSRLYAHGYGYRYIRLVLTCLS